VYQEKRTKKNSRVRRRKKDRAEKKSRINKKSGGRYRDSVRLLAYGKQREYDEFPIMFADFY